MPCSPLTMPDVGLPSVPAHVDGALAARVRRRLDGDDGFSLIEMLVAFVILGVAMSGSASFFMSAMLSLHHAESRTKATALANEELESLQALPWDDVGFYSDDDFGAPVPDGTVLVGPQRPTAARAPLPQETLEARGGVVFTVRRSLLWIQHTQTPKENDYKRLHVSVDWTDGNQQRTMSVESQRSPTAEEQPASDFTLSLLAVTPQFVHINGDGTLDAAVNPTLDLTALTSAKADFVGVRYVQRGDTTITERPLGSSDYLNWSAAVTDVHGDRFPNGDALFTFTATRASPYQEEVLGTALVRFVQPVVITAATLSPSSVCLSDTTPASPAIDVALSIDGLVEEDKVTVAWTGGQVTAVQTTATQSGSSLTAQIPEGTFTAGTHTVTLTGQRRSDAATDVTTREVVVSASCPA